MSNDAKRKIIMDIIDTVLTEEQRRSVILYYFDMLTVPEIAEVMNCTTGTVTSRLSARKKKDKGGGAYIRGKQQRQTSCCRACIYSFKAS